MRARAWGPLCASLLLLVGARPRAFNVPKQTDYVTDTAGALSRRRSCSDLNDRLGDYERQSGNQIFVLVTGLARGRAHRGRGLPAHPDLAPGAKGKDNGVLLIIATGRAPDPHRDREGRGR